MVPPGWCGSAELIFIEVRLVIGGEDRRGFLWLLLLFLVCLFVAAELAEDMGIKGFTLLLLPLLIDEVGIVGVKPWADMIAR